MLRSKTTGRLRIHYKVKVWGNPDYRHKMYRTAKKAFDKAQTIKGDVSVTRFVPTSRGWEVSVYDFYNGEGAAAAIVAALREGEAKCET